MKFLAAKSPGNLKDENQEKIAKFSPHFSRMSAKISPEFRSQVFSA